MLLRIPWALACEYSRSGRKAARLHSPFTRTGLQAQKGEPMLAPGVQDDL